MRCHARWLQVGRGGDGSWAASLLILRGRAQKLAPSGISQSHWDPNIIDFIVVELKPDKFVMCELVMTPPEGRGAMASLSKNEMCRNGENVVDSRVIGGIRKVTCPGHLNHYSGVSCSF